MTTRRTPLFELPGTAIGMVHVGASPGAPFAVDGAEAVEARAVADARALLDAGFEALIVENMHDRPYLRGGVGPEVVAAMTRVALAVRRVADGVPLGVQVLAAANREALAVAHAANADFVRAEGFVFAGVADEGLLDEAAAGPLLRYRRAIGADRIAVLADIKKKHSSHAITADVSLVETARAAVFCGADGVIVTGTATGRPADPREVAAVREAEPDVPLCVGSGITPENASDHVPLTDGLIIGTAAKEAGDWRNPVDPARASALVAAIRAAR